MKAWLAMNVYDFDGTIYNGDSSVDFFWFALKCKPSLVRYVPRQIMGFLLYGIKRIGKTKLKEFYFSFLAGVDAEKLADDFWNRYHQRIYKWYLDQQMTEDIVISASPEFLLKPICQRLGIRYLIASKVDTQSGRFFGANCRGAEKVRRLADEYHVTRIDKFYSDSRSDLPLAQISDQAYLVKKGATTQWMEG